ncbi:ABC transporter permease [Egbenema bharatensis]|uniref:ABC transporter permease n=1 Tax=Egbenema bharatensis TaxID=3463334 RepID=UPI003A887A36
MRRVLSQCYKELAQFRRDRLTVALAFILPFLTLLIFGYAIRLEAQNIPITIQDFDNTPLSRSYIERLYATNQFAATPRVNDVAEAIDRGVATAGVIIPPNFSQQVQSGRGSTVQVLIDGTDVNNARVIRNSIQATTRFFVQDSGLQTTPPSIRPVTRIWFNPGRQESLYIVPGTCAVILWIYPSLLAALAMVREKEQGTIVQVYASSLSASELLFGKVLAYLLVGLCEAIAVIGASMILFGLWFAGDPTPFLLATPLFITVATLFGLTIGTRATSQNAAVQAVATIGFLTAFLLSGFIYPLSNIPFPLSIVSNVVPARYYIPIIRDAFVRGTGWVGVWSHVLILMLLGFVLFQAARRNLSKMQLGD